MNYLDDESLKQGLIILQKEMIEKEEDAFEFWAERMVQLIKNYIKSGKVTVKSGIAVSTTGTAAAQTGTTTSTGEGTIS
ncbi:hypothetical protein [Riemerella anatipestifer]|uniref:Uncharacterized protein n=1 Tax=Riemerella anatipestifer TaxID=34085 RepID=A0A1S7DV90_RIEAN|nr:hypothetical protein [Riemerella anatipestifer]AQY22971.1 hypothetical protein AB406_2031 [Riemerella anatipestifer]MBT0550391.1 hypothetical protein [Riemerella anatipestifer]MBT0556851.1 hypothetical protein [Riemerella anatipestifer]MBT0561159.1 hypothetical protein [Riemerella anatipestifer]MCO7355774.1 hypothetical protein [Riemerella anatipestifer]